MPVLHRRQRGKGFSTVTAPARSAFKERLVHPCTLFDKIFKIFYGALLGSKTAVLDPVRAQEPCVRFDAIARYVTWVAL